MFIRLSLLRIHHRHSYHQNCYYYHGFLRAPIIAWPKTNGPSSNVMLWHRHRCDIKQNEELLLSSHAGGRVIIPTPLKIKQSIKSGFYDLIDGHTCIQTVCPTCPASTESSDATGNATTTSVPNNASSTATDSNFADQAQTGEKCLFINKTTGQCRSHQNLKKKMKRKRLNMNFRISHPCQVMLYAPSVSTSLVLVPSRNFSPKVIDPRTI